MPTTSPDNIYYADGTTPASLADITSAMATSVQNAFNVREMQSFSWANSTAKNAQTGMIIGDIGYQIDNLVYYRWDGSGWRIWAKAPAAYTPTISGIGVGLSNFTFSVASGTVNVSGVAVASGVASGAIIISLPSGFNINSVLLGVSSVVIIGNGGMDDSSSATDYPLGVKVLTASSISLIAYNTASTILNIVNTSASVPVAWASGDVLSVNFSYPVA
jgi:hypothetical protein